jgi:hypothetical protein
VQSTSRRPIQMIGASSSPGGSRTVPPSAVSPSTAAVSPSTVPPGAAPLPPSTVRTRSPTRSFSTATSPRSVAIRVPAAKHGTSTIAPSLVVRNPPLSAFAPNFSVPNSLPPAPNNVSVFPTNA